MKKTFILLAVALLTVSCAKTALVVAPVVPDATVYEQANMEFIGFKNLKKNDALLKNFGAELERGKVAFNKQDFYMGVYSLQELEAYKSTMRYVAFVDIEQLRNAWDDCIYDDYNLEMGGWIVAGCTCFALFPVYVPMICCANKNYCQLTVSCKCTLYIYDTLNKAIVLSVPMEYADKQVLEGQYSHKDTDRSAVTERARNLLYNEFFKYFDRAYRFLEEKGS